MTKDSRRNHRLPPKENIAPSQNKVRSETKEPLKIFLCLGEVSRYVTLMSQILNMTSVDITVPETCFLITISDSSMLKDAHKFQVKLETILRSQSKYGYFIQNMGLFMHRICILFTQTITTFNSMNILPSTISI